MRSVSVLLPVRGAANAPLTLDLSRPPALRDQFHRAGAEDLRGNLLRGGEILEFRLGVAEPDFPFPGVNTVIEQNKPCQSRPARRLDHKMSDRPGAAVDEHGLHEARDLVVGGASFAPDHEHCLCHGSTL